MGKAREQRPGAANDAGVRAHRLGTSAADLPKAGFRALDPVALADVTTAENIRASYRARAADPSATSEPGEAT